MKAAVVVAVYDERETIDELTRRLVAALDRLPGWTWELLYVVDGTDGTHELALEWAARRPEIRVLYQPAPGGLGAAFRRGFAALPADADYVVTMDADLNHQPEEIARLLDAAQRERADIVVGSRFVDGGKSEGTPLWKRALSRTLNAVMRRLFAVPVLDKTSGFRIYRASALAGLSYGGDDFAFLPELLIAAQRQGLRLREEPIHFVYRRRGRSKMGFWTTSWSYLSLFGMGGSAGGGESGAGEASGGLRGWIAAGVVVGVLAAVLASLEIAQPYYFLQDDNRDYHLPLQALASRALWQGGLAQFDFHQSLGTPLLAAGQPAVLSPVPYLAMAASQAVFGRPDAAIDLLVIFYFLAGGLGMLALGRELGLAPPARLFAALSWPLLPLNVYFSVSWCVVAPLVGLLPWLIAGTVRLSRGRPGWRAAAGLAVACSLLFLAGYPPWTAYAAVASILVVAVFLPGAGRRAERAGWLAVAALLAILLSLPLLAPLAFHTARSQLRAAALSYAEFASEALRPAVWVNGLVWPFVRLAAPDGRHAYSEELSPAVLTHLGFAALLLMLGAPALAARSASREDRARIIGLAIVAGCFLVWSFGWLSPWLYRLPLLNRFRWPVRLAFFFEFFAVLLAALGLDALLRRRAPRRAARVAMFIVTLQVGNLWLANLLHGRRGFVVHSDPVPLVEPWRTRLANGRIVSLGHYALGGRTDTLRSVGFNYPSLWGLFHMGGYDPMTPRDSYLATRGFSYSSSFGAEPEKLDVPFLRSWGVRWYVASPGALRAYGNWLEERGVHLVECEEHRCLFEDAAAPPLAAWTDTGAAGVGLPRVEGGELLVETHRPQAGDLVLAFLEQPFLNASIDGAPTTVRRLPAGQILVRVPAGPHLVRLRYDDPWFRAGCLGFAGGLVLIAVLAGIERRSRRRAAQGPAA